MPILGERFSNALVYAATLHREQNRKKTEIPYVSHLLATACIVLEHGGGEDEAIAALLHDAVEDDPEEIGGAVQLERIRKRFGDPVAKIVEDCSDTIEKVQDDRTWRVRKEEYICHLAKKRSASRLVSAADKLHNARAILADYRRHGEELWTRFNAGREDQLWYYRELVRVFRESGDNTELVAELEIVVGELGLAVALAGAAKHESP